jgi:RNA polymerase sigma-70 factor (ECF subfamily)
MLNPADSIATRQSLLVRMKNWEDRTGWQDFFNTYWKLIYGVAMQAGLTPTEAEDVVQETVIAVAKQIGEFKTDRALGSFKSWLLRIARRRIADQFRKRSKLIEGRASRPEETNRTDTIERQPDPASVNLDAVWEAEWEKHLYQLAVQKVKNQVSPKQFMLFHQQVIKEWPAGRVADQFEVSVAQVYMAKYRIGRLLKREVRRLRKQMP